jgi:tight adherence protein B
VAGLVDPDRGTAPGRGGPISGRRDLLAALTSGRRRADPALRAQVAAMLAATRLAEQLGAPLADVLDRCAAGVAAAGRAESARRVALAGPTSTARLLSALPIVGVLLGLALGADPVGALLDGGFGTGGGLVGLGLLALGHRWTSALVAAARSAGAGATTP